MHTDHLVWYEPENGAALPAGRMDELGFPHELEQTGQLPAGIHLLRYTEYDLCR